MIRNTTPCLALVAAMALTGGAKAQWNDLGAPHLDAPSQYGYNVIAVSPDGRNIAAHSTKLVMSPFSMEGRYITSTDYGATWSEHPASISAPNFLFWSGDALFVKEATESALKVSTDQGATFTVRNADYQPSYVSGHILRASIDSWFTIKQTSVMPPEFDLFRSTDQGATWNSVGPVSIAANPNFFLYDVANNGYIVSTSVVGASYSTDAGLTWNAGSFPTSLTVSHKNSLFKADNGDFILLEWAMKALYKSTDNGVTWAQVSTNIPSNVDGCGFYQNDLICTCADGSTYKSTDGGTTFNQLTAPGQILAPGSYPMTWSEDNLFVAGLNKVYRYGTLSAASVGEADGGPARIVVFPNPSNGRFMLANVPARSHVRILDITGKVVHEAGAQGGDVLIDAGHLNNGAYVVRVENQGHVTNKRLVISR